MGGCFAFKERVVHAVLPLPPAVGVAPDGVQHEYLDDLLIVYVDYGGKSGISRNDAFRALRAASPTSVMYLPVLDNGQRLVFLVPPGTLARVDTARERLATSAQMIRVAAGTVKVARRTGKRARADTQGVYDVYYSRWRAAERWTFLAPPQW